MFPDQFAERDGHGLRRVDRGWARGWRGFDGNVRRQLLAVQKALDLAPPVTLLVTRFDVWPRAVERRELRVDVGPLGLGELTSSPIGLDPDQRLAGLLRGRAGLSHQRRGRHGCSATEAASM